jgi:hypothetical protein
MSAKIRDLHPSVASKKPARAVTEIQLHANTCPADFREPLPASKAAINKGCTCPPQPLWPTVAFASDCPLHFVQLRGGGVAQQPNNPPVDSARAKRTAQSSSPFGSLYRTCRQ